MKRLSIETIKNYSEIKDPTCISIYLPTHKTGIEIKQDQIRFKNLVQQVRDTLEASGKKQSEVDKLLKPILELRDETPLWYGMSDGFVIFRSENHFSYNQFPVDFPELALVQSSFHLKPLLPLLTGNGLFYVLGLSQKNVQLFEGSKFSITEIDSSFLPENLNKALNIDEFLETKQFHTGTSLGRNDRVAIFHGHGGAEEDQKILIKQFFREIDKQLSVFLDDRDVPLILAGVEYLHPIYQEVNSHKGLVSEGVKGSPDQFNIDELHSRAWQAVSTVFDKEYDNALQKVNESNGNSSSELEALLKSAYEGKIDTLFVSINEQNRGHFDESTFSVKSSTNGNSVDLLDLVSVKTLLNGGKVFATHRNQIPDGHQALGLLRY